MTTNPIDTLQKLKRTLGFWQSRCIQDTYFPLGEAARTIGTPQRGVEARQDYPGRWIVRRPFSLSIRF